MQERGCTHLLLVAFLNIPLPRLFKLVTGNLEKKGWNPGRMGEEEEMREGRKMKGEGEEKRKERWRDGT